MIENALWLAFLIACVLIAVAIYEGYHNWRDRE